MSQQSSSFYVCLLFFINATAPTAIYTLSLHDALPILERFQEQSRTTACRRNVIGSSPCGTRMTSTGWVKAWVVTDRKSTRLNSSHTVISYAVFCLKKKTNRIDEVVCAPNTIVVYLSPR